MITEQKYKDACANRDAAEKVIQLFHKQGVEDFDARWKRFENKNEYFRDDELTYAAGARCDKCNAGLAHPKKCGVFHQWTCSDVLKGIGTDDGHSTYPFAFYKIKSEEQPSAQSATTRPKI